MFRYWHVFTAFNIVANWFEEQVGLNDHPAVRPRPPRLLERSASRLCRPDAAHGTRGHHRITRLNPDTA